MCVVVFSGILRRLYAIWYIRACCPTCAPADRAKRCSANCSNSTRSGREIARNCDAGHANHGVEQHRADRARWRSLRATDWVATPRDLSTNRATAAKRRHCRTAISSAAIDFVAERVPRATSVRRRQICRHCCRCCRAGRRSSRRLRQRRPRLQAGCGSGSTSTCRSRSGSRRVDRAHRFDVRVLVAAWMSCCESGERAPTDSSNSTTPRSARRRSISAVRPIRRCS